jgi:hypothetical protein
VPLRLVAGDIGQYLVAQQTWSGAGSLALGVQVAAGVNDADDQDFTVRRLIDDDVLPDAKTSDACAKVASCPTDVGITTKVGECLADLLTEDLTL